MASAVDSELNKTEVLRRLDQQQIFHQKLGIWIAIVMCSLAGYTYLSKGDDLAAAAEVLAGVLAVMALTTFRAPHPKLREILIISAIVVLTMNEPLLLGGLDNPATAASLAKLPVLYMAMFGYERFLHGVGVLGLAVAAILVAQNTIGVGQVPEVGTGGDALRQLLGVLVGVIMMANRERLRVTLMDEINNVLIKNQEALELKATSQNSMFGIIAHELRTPASAIEMGLHEAANSPLDEESLRELTSTSSHLLSVIDDLRVAVDPELELELHPVSFDFQDMEFDVLRQVGSLMESQGISLDIHWQPLPNTRYEADAYRIRSILTNLLRNAAYHSEGSVGRLSLRVTPLQDGNHQVIFKVEDDGKGIPSSSIGRLFEPFERGETPHRGTGVGLHIVKSWTELMGGSVAYEPSALGGAGFVIELPLYPIPESAVDQASQIAESSGVPALRGKRILLVEDDQLLGIYGERVLTRDLQADVTLASDGEEAYRLVQSVTPDVVITDYFMPNMDGAELIRKLREDGLNSVLIACTAASIGGEKQELLEAGADAVIVKPLSYEKLADALS